MKDIGKANTGAIVGFEILEDGLEKRNTGDSMSNSKSGKKKLNLKSDDEIARACQIEACQAAVYSTIGELVGRYGRDVVFEAVEWFTDILRPQEKKVGER